MAGKTRSSIRTAPASTTAPMPEASARKRRWRRRLVLVLLPPFGGLLGAAVMPRLLAAGHLGACLLYALAVVIACSIASTIIAPPMELDEAPVSGVEDGSDDGRIPRDERAGAVARHLERLTRDEPHHSTVLFVDDDSAVREVVIQMLAEKGFAVLSAPDAHAALRALLERPVDLLFADIAMPDIDGVELARRARILRPGIRVLFATGYPTRAAERDAVDYGKLLVKPLRRDELLREVEVALSA